MYMTNKFCRDVLSAIELELELRPEVGQQLGSNMDECIRAAREMYMTDNTIERQLEEVTWKTETGETITELFEGEVMGLHVQTKEDREVEKERKRWIRETQECPFTGEPLPGAWVAETYMDDGVDISTYFTRGGNNRVRGYAGLISGEAIPEQEPTSSIDGQYAPNDWNRTAAGFDRSELSEPCWKNFYSVSKAWPRHMWVPQERNFHKIVGYIWKHKDNKSKLQAAWKRFWVRVYHAKMIGPVKQGEERLMLTAKQITCIKNLFNKFGIHSHK